MRYLMNLVVTTGILAGTASYSEAQVAVSVGNPYYGQGLYLGSGYGYGTSVGYSGYGLGYPVTNNYGVNYGNVYGTPYRPGIGTFGYSSGYRGVVGPVGGPGYGSSYGYGSNYGYGYAPSPIYRSYGYAPRPGFRPFGRRFR